MRVSVVAGGLRAVASGGLSWRFLTEAAAGLAALGHDVEFVTDGPLGVDLPGVPTWYPGKGEPGEAPRSLVDHLRADRPHVVIWNTTPASALHGRPRVLAGTRHIALFTEPCATSAEPHHGFAIFSDRPFRERLGSLIPRRRLAGFLERSFDGVVVPAWSTALELIDAGLSVDHARLVQPGRDQDVTPRSDPWPVVSDEVTFIVADDPACGRDVEFVVHAFEEATRTAPNARLLTRSIDPASDRADRLAQMATADVLLLPPRLASSEIPFAMLDAAGVGLPLVAPDVASVRDVAAPGSLLFAPGSREALRAAIVRFATEPDIRVSAATMARDWFDAWPTWNDTSRRLAAVIGLDDEPREWQEIEAMAFEPDWPAHGATGSAA